MTATTNETHTPADEQSNTAPTGGQQPDQDIPTVADATDDDLGIIVPTPTSLTIDDVPAEVRRLKSREFLTLMRVITQGLGSGIGSIRLDFNDSDALQSDLMAIMFMAIPNSIEEFGAFLSMIVDPRNPNNKAEADKLNRHMENPDPDVLIDVLGVMVLQEKDDLVALAGKAKAWIATVQKATGQGTTPTT